MGPTARLEWLCTMKEIVVLSNRNAAAFASEDTCVAITFIGTHHGDRTPPKLLQRVPRIVIRADDCYPSSTRSTALTIMQASRIAGFVNSNAAKISTLLVSCRHGEGRSASVALTAAAAYNLDYRSFSLPPYVPNGWIVDLLDAAFTNLGLTIPPIANVDPHYDPDREQAFSRDPR